MRPDQVAHVLERIADPWPDEEWPDEHRRYVELLQAKWVTPAAALRARSTLFGYRTRPTVEELRAAIERIVVQEREEPHHEEHQPPAPVEVAQREIAKCREILGKKGAGE